MGALWPAAAACGCLGLLLAGCAGYQLGHQGLFPSQIRTVSVPVFESASFRRNLGEMLTEAVVKQIELKTPYKVTNDCHADSVLLGRLVADTKRITAESRTDEPRQLELSYRVEIRWLDRTGQVLRQQSLALPDALVDLTGTVSVVPEAGQSIASSQFKELHRLAARIAGLLENPW